MERMEDLELERRYLAQIAIDPQGTDKLRHQVVNRLADQIVSDPAGSLSSEIHAKWWKLGYHKPIEHYRRLLKDKTGKAQHANAQMNQLVDEGLGTVMGLVRALLSKYELQVDISGLFLDLGLPDPSSDKPPHSKFSCPAVQRLVSHLLVSAGDLARYRCQLRQAFLTQDRFSLSRLFYTQASVCQPSFGHLYNMLAVVASQLDAPLETVYWYIRSQCCQEPSQMGRDNLLTYLKSAQMQKHKGLEPLVQLVLHNMFRVGQAPMRPTKFESSSDQAKLWIALILIGLNWIQTFDIASWYPFDPSGYTSSESQLIAYLGQRLRILQLPAKVCLDNEADAMRRNLEGFLPIADADQLTQRAALPPSSEMDEEIILFTGFKS